MNQETLRELNLLWKHVFSGMTRDQPSKNSLVGCKSAASSRCAENAKPPESSAAEAAQEMARREPVEKEVAEDGKVEVVIRAATDFHIIF